MTLRALNGRECLTVEQIQVVAIFKSDSKRDAQSFYAYVLIKYILLNGRILLLVGGSNSP